MREEQRKVVLLDSSRWLGSGVKEVGSIALGMTLTFSGASPLRSTKFSRLQSRMRMGKEERNKKTKRKIEREEAVKGKGGG